MQIKDLKVGNKLEMLNKKFKVLEIHNKYVAVLNETGEIELLSEQYLKDYTLVTPEWNASELKAMDAYYYINSTGQLSIAYWRNDRLDIFRLKAGLIYQTKELAQKAIEEINNK